MKKFFLLISFALLSILSASAQSKGAYDATYDVNGDGKCNSADVLALVDWMVKTKGEYDWKYDFNGDWVCDANDVKALVHYLLMKDSTVPVSNILVTPASLTMKEGGYAVLHAGILPSNAANQYLRWTSSNTDVAETMDSLVIAKAEGTATITVAACDDSGVSTTCLVTVTTSNVPVSEISLQSELSVAVGGTSYDLLAHITPSTATNKKVTWTSSDPSVATVSEYGDVTGISEGTATITCTAQDGSGVTASCLVSVHFSYVSEISLSSPIMHLTLGNTVTVATTIKPEDASNKQLTWTSSDPSVVSITADGTMTGVAEGTATITCTAQDGSGVSTTSTVNVIQPETREYVDLGLPSGTKWATHNIGATLPEDYGDFFAWGETLPFDGFDGVNKRYFSWGTYKWADGTYNSITKYCTREGFGEIDGKAVLEPEDDAAYVNWGSEWKMPSYEQINELTDYDYTTQTGITLNGVNGELITSKTNGNSIFLPAAGYREVTSYMDFGKCGYYWSTMIYSYGSSTACTIEFYYKGRCDWRTQKRCDGLTIRPVRVFK